MKIRVKRSYEISAKSVLLNFSFAKANPVV